MRPIQSVERLEARLAPTATQVSLAQVLQAYDSSTTGVAAITNFSAIVNQGVGMTIPLANETLDQMLGLTADLATPFQTKLDQNQKTWSAVASELPGFFKVVYPFTPDGSGHAVPDPASGNLVTLTFSETFQKNVSGLLMTTTTGFPYLDQSGAQWFGLLGGPQQSTSVNVTMGVDLSNGTPQFFIKDTPTALQATISLNTGSTLSSTYNIGDLLNVQAAGEAFVNAAGVLGFRSTSSELDGKVRATDFTKSLGSIVTGGISPAGSPVSPISINVNFDAPLNFLPDVLWSGTFTESIQNSQLQSQKPTVIPPNAAAFIASEAPGIFSLAADIPYLSAQSEVAKALNYDIPLLGPLSKMLTGYKVPTSPTLQEANSIIATKLVGSFPLDGGTLTLNLTPATLTQFVYGQQVNLISWNYSVATPANKGFKVPLLAQNWPIWEYPLVQFFLPLSLEIDLSVSVTVYLNMNGGFGFGGNGVNASGFWVQAGTKDKPSFSLGVDVNGGLQGQLNSWIRDPNRVAKVTGLTTLIDTTTGTQNPLISAGGNVGVEVAGSNYMTAPPWQKDKSVVYMTDLALFGSDPNADMWDDHSVSVQIGITSNLFINLYTKTLLDIALPIPPFPGITVTSPSWPATPPTAGNSYATAAMQTPGALYISPANAPPNAPVNVTLSESNGTVTVAGVQGKNQFTGVNIIYFVGSFDSGSERLAVTSTAANPFNIPISAVGGNGPVYLQGGAAYDTLIAGSGADTLVAGSGNDILYAGTGADVLVGGSGNDTLDASNSTGNVLMDGGSGNSTMRGGSGNDTINAGTGNDLINDLAGALKGAYSGLYVIDGGSGSDTIYAGSGKNDTIIGGTAGDNRVYGSTSGYDEILGGGPGDTLYGGAGGHDTIFGAGGGNNTMPSNNRIYGGDGGSNLITGGGSGDVLYGAVPTANTIYGGNNTIYGGTGNETLYGGDGVGLAVDITGHALVNAAGDGQSLGGNQLTAANGNTLIYGDSIGSNTLAASSGNDTLWAGSGGDYLSAGSGVDSLYGGNGDDLFALHFTATGTQPDTVWGNGGVNGLVLEPDVVVPPTITSTITATATTMTMTDTSALNASSALNFVIQIDNEQMLVTSISGNTLTVQRGYSDTTPVTHNANAVVVLQNPILASTIFASDTQLTVDNTGALGSQTVLNGVQVTGNTTTGSELLTGMSSLANLSVGQAISGPGIPANTTIVVINVAANTVQISNPATASNAVSAPVQFSCNLIIRIDNEEMVVDGVNGKALTVTRGYNNTNAAPHNMNAMIFLEFRPAPKPLDYNLSLSVVPGGTPSQPQYQASLSNLDTGKPLGQIIFSVPSDVANVLLKGGPGNNNITVSPNVTRPLTIYGGVGNNTLVAGSGNETLVAGSGSTILWGGPSNDVLYGGQQPTQISGNISYGQKSITGLPETGDLGVGQTVTGTGIPAGTVITLINSSSSVNISNAATATLNSVPFSFGSRTPDGHDTLIAGTGNSELIAGGGGDLLIGGPAVQQNGQWVLQKGAGQDVLEGGAGNDLLVAGPDTSNVAMTAGSGNDTLVGGPGQDIMQGGAGNDLLLGGNVMNVMQGGAGNSTLVGGTGLDLLTAGSGNQTLYDYPVQPYLTATQQVALSQFNLVLPSPVTQTTNPVQAYQNLANEQNLLNPQFLSLQTLSPSLSEPGSTTAGSSTITGLPSTPVTGFTSSGSYTVTGVNTSFLNVGEAVSGPGIPIGTIIDLIDPKRGSITISNPASTTSSIRGSNLTVSVQLFPGEPVTGPGILDGTTIASVPSATSIILSSPASATANNVGLNFWLSPDQSTQLQSLQNQLAAINYEQGKILKSVGAKPPIIDYLAGGSGNDQLYGKPNGYTWMVAGSGPTTFYNYNTGDNIQGNSSSSTLMLQGDGNITLTQDSNTPTNVDVSIPGQNTWIVGNGVGNLSGITAIAVTMLAGPQDSVTVGNLSQTLFGVSISGGSGTDLIDASNFTGHETLMAGTGKDTVKINASGLASSAGAVSLQGGNSGSSELDIADQVSAPVTVAASGLTIGAAVLPTSAFTGFQKLVVVGGANNGAPVTNTFTSDGTTVGTNSVVFQGGSGTNVTNIFNISGGTATLQGGNQANNQFNVTGGGNYTVIGGTPNAPAAPLATSPTTDIAAPAISPTPIRDANLSNSTLGAARYAAAATTLNTSSGSWAVFAGGMNNGVVSNVVDVYSSIPTTQDTELYLTVPRSYMAATTVMGSDGPQAIFAGGVTGTNYSNQVDILDSSTFHISSAPGQLSLSRAQIAATSVGSFAFFAGGITVTGYTDQVDVYNAMTQTWQTPTQLPSGARGNLAATSIGTLAFFAGGQGSQSASAAVDIYDASTGKWDPSLTLPGGARSLLTATTVGTKVIFAGGFDASGKASAAVDIYDTSTNTWVTNTQQLSVARGYLAATTLGSCAIFAGGFTGSVNSNAVDIYNSSTGTWSTDQLSSVRSTLCATTAGDRAIFAGGSPGNNTGAGCNTLDVFVFPTVTQSTPQFATLNDGRYGLAGTSVGPYALFAGGIDNSLNPSSNIDIYTSVYGGSIAVYPLAHPRTSIAATTVGNEAIFAGGVDKYNSLCNDVDIYDLSKGWTQTTLSYARSNMAAASNGNLAIFVGGKFNYDSGQNGSTLYELYDVTKGQFVSAGNFTGQGRWNMVATTVGPYAIFAGGTYLDSANHQQDSNEVDIYNFLTNTWMTASTLPGGARSLMGATTVGTLAIFAGGVTVYGVPSNDVDIYNIATGSWSSATLSLARGYLAATTIGPYAIFAGGNLGGNNTTDSSQVDIYNSLTGEWTTSQLTQARSSLAATTVGGTAVFAGGSAARSGPNLGSSVIDLFNLPPTATINTPSSVVGPTTTISYTLASANTTLLQNVTTNIVAQYSVNGGPWQNATVNRGDGTTNLSSNTLGVPHTIVWNNGQDLGITNNPSVQFRIIPTNTTNNAGCVGATSGNFAVDNAGVVNALTCTFNDKNDDDFRIAGNSSSMQLSGTTSAGVWFSATGTNLTSLSVAGGSGTNSFDATQTTMPITLNGGNGVDDFLYGGNASDTFYASGSTDVQGFGAANELIYTPNPGDAIAYNSLLGQVVLNGQSLNLGSGIENFLINGPNQVLVPLYTGLPNSVRSQSTTTNTQSGSPFVSLSAAFNTTSNEQTAYINWGDGVITSGQATSDSAGWTVTGSHLYSTVNNYTINVIFVDADNRPLVASTTFNGGLGLSNGIFTLTSGSNSYPIVSGVKQGQVDSNNQVLYYLNQGGLASWSQSASYQNLDPNSKSFALRGDGVVFDLRPDGTLYRIDPGNSSPQNLDSNVQVIVMGQDNTLYALYQNGILKSLSPSAILSSSSFVQIDQNVQSINLDSDGVSVDDLESGGLYQKYSPSSLWTVLGQPSLSVSTSRSVTAGAGMSVTVKVINGQGTVATGFLGTVNLASSDGLAVLQVAYAFTVADAGAHTFTNVILKSAGIQSLAATIAGQSNLTGSSSLTVNPAAASVFNIVAAPSVTAGHPGALTVTVFDSYGNVATGYLGTIKFSSTDPKAFLPASYKFTAADNGSHTFAGGANLVTVGEQTISVADTNTNSLTGTVTSVVVPGAAATLSQTIASGCGVGTTLALTVTVLDAYGNVATGYAGTIHIASSDSHAVLPADYTFTSIDNGVHVFSVTFNTAGSQSLTVGDTSTTALRTPKTVVVGSATTLSLTVPAQVVAGSPFTVTVTAMNASGGVATGYTGTVQFQSSDPNSQLPSNYTFLPSDNGTHTFTVLTTLKTAGVQNLFVNDASSSSVSGTASPLVVAAPAKTLGLAISSLTTTAGAELFLTATAFDAYRNVATGYLVTVQLTSSDIHFVPLNYTFTTADAGSHTLRLILTTAGTQSLTVQDTANAALKASQAGIQVTAAAASNFSFSVISSTVTAGTAQTLTLIVLDSFGNLVTNYTGTVQLTSSDPQAKLLPSTYTFTNTDAGKHVFTFTLKTTGSQSLTVTDTLNASLTGSLNINVTH